MPRLVPTRLTVADPAVNSVIQDIYDKLQSIENPAPTPTPTPTPVTPTIISIQGASGQAAGPQLAFLPDLPVLPSNNPATGAPYAQDGLALIVSPTPLIPGPIWRYTTEGYEWTRETCPVLFDTHANRIANYAASSYPIALFVETDTLLTLQSTGTEWVTISGFISDTHANRLANWPSVEFSVGTQFYETDRTVYYEVKDATGTITVAGGVNVTWTAGDHFVNSAPGFVAAQWPAATSMVITGVAYPILTTNSATSVTLATAAVNGAGQSYSVASGRWVYRSGQYSAALASLPTDIGENETTLVSTKVAFGFLFYENAAYAHQLQWNVSAWQRGPWDEEHSDTFHSFGAAPTDIGWQNCDGTVGVTFLKYDGTTGTRTVPNLNATAAFEKGGSAYSATITAPVVPTSSALVFTGAAVTGTVAAPAFTGASAGIGTATFTPDAGGDPAMTSLDGSDTSYTPAGTNSAPAFTGNAATGTINTPVISLPGDPVANFLAIRMYRR